ncbi:ATP synthase subunit alpha [compost metagenome]
MPINKVRDFEGELHGFMKSQKADLVKELNTKSEWNEAIEKSLKAALEEFKKGSIWSAPAGKDGADKKADAGDAKKGGK